MINNVTLVGRLTKDPEIKETSGGVKVGAFTLAVDRNYKNSNDERETDFIPVVVWRKTAEICEKYLKKGNMCGVVGSVQTRSYEAQDGTKRYVTEILANEVQFFSSGNKESAEADAE